MASPEHRYGWHPSPPDSRDAVADTRGLTILPVVDPRSQMRDPYDQGDLGSCTAFAYKGAVEYDADLDGEDRFEASALGIYWGERLREGTVKEDSGAYGHDAFKDGRRYGVGRDDLWPYYIDRFDETPPEVFLQSRSAHVVPRYTHPGLGYWRSTDERKAGLKRVLSNRQTVAFGFTVFESFESLETERTGIVKVPNPLREKVLGGHEPLLVGYTVVDGTEYALVRNSWGTEWGDGGYCYFPWEFLLDLRYCEDFRSIYRPVGA